MGSYCRTRGKFLPFEFRNLKSWQKQYVWKKDRSGNGHSFFSTAKIKLGGQKPARDTWEQKQKSETLDGSPSRGQFSVTFALTHLTEFSEQRETMRNWGNPLIDMRGIGVRYPMPSLLLLPQAQVRPLTVICPGFCADDRGSKSRWRRPETVWKFPHVPVEFRDRTKYFPSTPVE